MQDSVIKAFWEVCEKYPAEIALMSKDKAGKWQEISYSEFRGLFERFGAGLLDFGVKRGDHVGIITDNRKEWIIANLGILGIGAADVPRGSDTMPDEARYILAARRVQRDPRGERRAGPEDPLAEEGPPPAEDDHRDRRGLRPGRLQGADPGGEPADLRRHHGEGKEAPREGPAGLPAGAGEGKARGPGHADLHLGHHGRAQGRHAHPRELPAQAARHRTARDPDRSRGRLPLRAAGLALLRAHRRVRRDQPRARPSPTPSAWASVMLADMVERQAHGHGLGAPDLGGGARGHHPQDERGRRDQEGPVQLLRRGGQVVRHRWQPW